MLIRRYYKQIINEDQLLELITINHREIIDTAYNLSTHVNSFKEWQKGFKRIVAGQIQIKKEYPQLLSDSDFSRKRLLNYMDRFYKIDSIGKKTGILAMFLIRNTLKTYYTLSDNIVYNPIWEETKSTKCSFNNT